MGGYQQPDGKLVQRRDVNQLAVGNRQVVVARLGTTQQDADFPVPTASPLFEVGLANDAGLGCAMALDGDVLVTGYTR